MQPSGQSANRWQLRTDRQKPTLLSVLVLCALGCILCGCSGGQGSNAAQKPEVVDVDAQPVITLVPEKTPSPTPLPTQDPAMEPFTIAWFGDTQSYASAYPAQFDDMVQWVVDNRDAYHIRYVIHTGDIVNQPEIASEWDTARHALSRLTGVLPFFSVAGNHDQLGVLTQTGQDYTPYTALMDALGCADSPYLAGHDKTWRRRFDRLTIGHEKFLIIGVGYQLSHTDYDWLNSVLTSYADHTAILVAHYYLDFDGAMRGEGKHLFRNVVMQHENVKYVLCGHRHRVLHRIQDVDVEFDRIVDRRVYAFMNDYMGYADGGGGYILLLTFDPVKREIRVTSYSPVRDDFNYFDDETVETFSLPYLP